MRLSFLTSLNAAFKKGSQKVCSERMNYKKCLRKSQRRCFRPGLELLEDRLVPTVNIAPGDVTGLIQAIDQADTTPNTATIIDLAPGSTYVLSTPDNYWYGPNGLPPIASNITINGNINIDGSTSNEGAVIERAPGAVPFRIFYVSGGLDASPALTLPSGTLTLNNLTVEGGLAQGGNGGNSGTAPGGGAAGLGGAIFSQGTLDLNGVTLTQNIAQGGAGGLQLETSEDVGGGGGGGIGGDGGGGVSGGGGGGFAAPGGLGTQSEGGNGGYGVTGLEGGIGEDTLTEQNANPGLLGGGGGGGVSNNGGNGGVGGGGGGAGTDTSGGNGGFGGGGGGGNPFTSGFGFGGFGGGGGFYDSGGFGGGLGGPSNVGSGVGGAGGGGGGAGMGGAIFNMSNSLTITNSTLSVNTAEGGQSNSRGGSGYGGAIFNLNGTVSLINDTMAGNHVVGGLAGSADGDDVYNLALQPNVVNVPGANSDTATINLTNDILGGNEGGNDLVNDSEAGTNSAVTNVLGRSLVQQDTSGVISGTSNLMTADPDLGPLQNNGGPTPTMEVLDGSPVLTTAGVAPTNTNGVPLFDQRGLLRNSTTLLGAYQATLPSQLAVQLTANSFPVVVSAGTPMQFYVYAEDAFGKTVYTYNGTVSFAATGLAVLPPPHTLVQGGALVQGNGVLSGFNVAAIGSSGVQAITVTDGDISGTSGLIVVTPASSTQTAGLNFVRPSTVIPLTTNSQLATNLQAAIEEEIQLGYSTVDVEGDPNQPVVLGSLWSGINTLPAQSAPILVNMNLEGGTYPVQTVAPPSNVIVNLSAGTITGDAPSVTIDDSQGQVIIIDVTFVDLADSPTLAVLGGNVTLTDDTILGYLPPSPQPLDSSPTFPVVSVTGGSVTMRGDTVKSSSSAPAVSITGGTADLGMSLTPTDPGFGGNTFNGPEVLIRNATKPDVYALGNTFEHNGTTLTTPAGIGAYIADTGAGPVIYSGFPTQTTLTSSVHLPVVGSLVTLTATVKSQVAAAGQPAGTVTFYEIPKVGAKVMLGSGTLNGNGVATWSGQLKVSGSGLVATYPTAGIFAGSSGLLDVSVAPASTATALVSSLNPATTGQSVTFTATITVTGSGSGTPQGTVAFYNGKVLLGSETVATVNGQQQASYSTTALSVGNHAITATYTDTTDSNFAASTSTALSQVVNAAPTTRTYVTVSGPEGLAFYDGNLYVADDADNASGNQYVSEVTPSKVAPGGIASTFVSSTLFDHPRGLAFDSAGNLYIANAGNGTVSKVTRTGVVSTFASNLGSPVGLAFDTDGTLYVSAPGTIFKLSSTGVPSVLATFGGDQLGGLAFYNGNLYVADVSASTVYKVTLGGVKSTVTTEIYQPYGLALNASGNLYVSSYNNNFIDGATLYEVSLPTGEATTLATGFTAPLGLAVDSHGNIYVASPNNSTVSEVTP
jgi:sugar lactone lactonase YvrE